MTKSSRCEYPIQHIVQRGGGFISHDYMKLMQLTHSTNCSEGVADLYPMIDGVMMGDMRWANVRVGGDMNHNLARTRLISNVCYLDPSRSIMIYRDLS